MTRNARKWARRVADWRASGETSTTFCAGRDFTPGGLRHWAYRLGRTAVRRQLPEPDALGQGAVRLARVIRKGAEVATASATALVPVPRRAGAPASSVSPSGVSIAVGPYVVAVGQHFDSATLGGVLDVLDARRGRSPEAR